MVSKETKLLHRSMFLEWERELYANRDPFAQPLPGRETCLRPRRCRCNQSSEERAAGHPPDEEPIPSAKAATHRGAEEGAPALLLPRRWF